MASKSTRDSLNLDGYMTPVDSETISVAESFAACLIAAELLLMGLQDARGLDQECGCETAGSILPVQRRGV